MTTFSINGKELKGIINAPEFSLADIDNNSGRDVKTQKMHRNRARANTMKWSLEFAYVDSANLKTALSLLSNKTFNLTYHDPLTDSDVTKEFYAGDRSGSIIMLDDGYYAKSLKVDLIEC